MTVNKLYHDRGVALVQAQCVQSSGSHKSTDGAAPVTGGRNGDGPTSAGDAATGDSVEVFRTDEVQLTSTLFSGGDWHWRLASAAGDVLVEGCGYRSQSQCLEAVALLQGRAKSASLEVA